MIGDHGWECRELRTIVDHPCLDIYRSPASPVPWQVSAPLPGRLHRARGSREAKATPEVTAAPVEPQEDTQVPPAAPNDTQVEPAVEVTSPKAWKVDTFDEDVEELKRRYKAKSPRDTKEVKATKASAGDFGGGEMGGDEGWGWVKAGFRR